MPPRLAFLGVRACEIAACWSRTGSLAAGPFVDDDYRARRAAALVDRRRVHPRRSDLLLHLDGHRPRGDRGATTSCLTELDDGFVVRWPAAGETGCRPLLGCAPATRRAAGGRGRRRRRGRARARMAATASRPMGCRAPDGPARPPALGRGRRALPGVHQLHAGLPDLLLHQRRPASPTSTAPSTHDRATLGLAASRATSRRSPAATSGRGGRTAIASG